MLRWLIVVVLMLVVFQRFGPWLHKIGFGRLPGDLHFRWRGREWRLPITSTLLLSWLVSVLARGL